MIKKEKETLMQDLGQMRMQKEEESDRSKKRKDAVNKGLQTCGAGTASSTIDGKLLKQLQIRNASCPSPCEHEIETSGEEDEVANVGSCQ